MKNTSKICFGLITIFSFTACSSGTKVTRDEFFEEAAKIKSDSFKKAKLTYFMESKKEENSDISEQTSELSGTFIKDSLGKWEKDDTTSSTVGSIFSFMISNINLNSESKNRNKFETSYPSAEEKYYVKPFSYDCSYKDDNYYGSYISYSSLKEKYSTVAPDVEKGIYTEESHYEWNKFGLLTSAEVKTELKYEHKKQKVKEVCKYIVKITYK